MSSNDSQPERNDEDWRTDPVVFCELVMKGMARGVREAIAEHHRAGNPVSIGEDGRVVLLYPDGSTGPLPEPPETGPAQ
jgi:hypothetical protein